MSTICLVTALAAEAQPLIEHYRLRRMAVPGLRVWSNDDYCLLQTGIGKLQAASRLAAWLPQATQVRGIINVGICGADRPMGNVLMAHSVIDDGSQRRWYPHLPARRDLGDTPTLDLRTLDTPSSHYTSNTMFDMEAAGVAIAATAHVDMACVHFIKAVSDNPEHSLYKVSPQSIAPLMTGTLPLLDRLCACLTKQHHDLFSEAESVVETLSQRCHHTVTERHTLRRLVQRYAALHGEPLAISILDKQQSARAIREHLQQSLDNASLHY